jgi:hypothetical protein
MRAARCALRLWVPLCDQSEPDAKHFSENQRKPAHAIIVLLDRFLAGQRRGSH